MPNHYYYKIHPKNVEHAKQIAKALKVFGMPDILDTWTKADYEIISKDGGFIFFSMTGKNSGGLIPSEQTSLPMVEI
jgi:hypothetical protein